MFAYAGGLGALRVVFLKNNPLGNHCPFQNYHYSVGTYHIIPRGTAQKGLVLEKNALNRLVHNLLELISKGYNPTDLSQQPSCNFPGKQIKILFHNLYVD